jgi:hypothetical protein
MLPAESDGSGPVRDNGAVPPRICQAVAQRQMLAFDYDRHHRIVEPHCHGPGVDGRELLRAYQVGGTSASGPLGWKLFDAARITSMRVLDEHFAPRPDYRADDPAMHPVHCCV